MLCMPMPAASVAVLRFALLAGGCLAFVGACKEREPIRAEKEAKPEYELPYSEPEHVEKIAILGGIAPAGNGSEWWFFKMTGPVEMIRAERPNFEAFIKSLQFNPLAETDWKWQVPAGWNESFSLPGGGRIATFRTHQNIETYFPPASGVLGAAGGLHLLMRVEDLYGLYFPELTVSLARGSLIDNVNRWRTQVGLANLLPSDLNRYMRLVPVEHAVVFVVEMAGPTLKAPPRKAMMADPH